MLLKYFYDDALAHASYLVGCQRTGTALVVDPGRDIAPYLEIASRNELKIVAVAETHIHADYVSGARELAASEGAKLYVSDEGPADWKYGYLQAYDHQLLKDGDHFMLGNVRFDVLHTPGHTPESLSFVLTDQGGGADQPMGIFTGDFVFVGSIGRPDLLEQAAGIADSAEPGARDLFRSVQRFRQLPDYLQVWPAHGAGSACGKGLGAIPNSTVGYEKRFNPALQIEDEDEFVRYILSDQPEAPNYFAIMKQVNKQGPELLAEKPFPPMMPPRQIEPALESGTVIDLSNPTDYAERHVPGTINIAPAMLAAWAGWLVDYQRPTYLIGTTNTLVEAVGTLRKIGVENIAGRFDATAVVASGKACESYPNKMPENLVSAIEAGQVTLIDVRSDAEWQRGHIKHARHHFLGRLPQQLDEIPRDAPVVVHCQGGARSAIAASVLRADGFEVINMQGGYAAWQDSQRSAVESPEPMAEPIAS